MNITTFLTKLDTNLNVSMNAFRSINKNGVGDLLSLQEIIQKNINNLYTYLENLHQLESLYFNDDSINKGRFLLQLNPNTEINPADLKTRFKDSLKIKINIHKMKEEKKRRDANKIQNISLNKIDDCSIEPNSISIPVIKHIKDLPQAFYWYEGDKTHKQGIYICLSPGFHIRIPFPSVVMKDDENYKRNSVPCKYETREACNEHKKRNSELYHSEVRNCMFVHKKEQFSKLSSIYKCSIESFGNHSTLSSDLNYIKLSDIKRILMYALSDSLLTTIWFQNKFKDGDLLLNNIDYY
jgi:hypothetical protein